MPLQLDDDGRIGARSSRSRLGARDATRTHASASGGATGVVQSHMRVTPNKMRAVVFALLALCALASAQTVLVLTEENFETTLAEQPKMLVEFYAPWCGHCKQLAPKYDAAAAKLGAKGVLAKVDCTENGDLCQKYGVKGYPTLKFFSAGQASEYQKGRTTDDIVNFILEQGKPAVSDLNTADEAKAFVAEAVAPVTAIAFFGSTATDATKAVFAAVADALRMDGFSFGSSDDAAVAQAFDVPSEHGADGVTIVAFKKFDTPQVTFADEIDAEKLTAFLHTEAMPLFGEIGPETYKKYVDRKLPLVYFFVDPNDVTEKAAVEAGKAVAAEFKGKLSLCSIDGVQYAKHGESLGVKATPMVVLHDMVKNKKYLTAQVNTADELRSFFSKWEAGTLIAHVKSEEIPERGTDAVQTLVGKNFESVAFDKTKDVLVEFYAPWCGHCKELAPKYEKLAAKFAGDNNVIIAKLDATANDVPVEIEGFPTIIFYAAGEDQTGVPYEGDRSIDAMYKFVTENRKSEAAAAAAAAAHDEL